MTSDARTITSEPGGTASYAPGGIAPLIGRSSLFLQTLAVLDSVAANDCIVLLEGESGTGKELLARRIHEVSRRRNKPFIPLNCAAVSESLFPSQLFGHVKGAFTGAEGETLGVVRAAAGGTLLLDEVGEIPLTLQAQLLRLIQHHEVTPVGASRPAYVDTRFVVSTNRSLQRMVQTGDFRLDLYHRLNIVRIEVPPLRSRPDDIDPLLDHFLSRFAEEYARQEIRLSAALRRELRLYPWPGNIRELEGYVERLYATGNAPLPPGSLAWDDGYRYGPAAQSPVHAPGQPPVAMSDQAWGGAPAAPGALAVTPDSISPALGRLTGGSPTPQIDTLAHVEQQAIARALTYAGGNRTAAARLLDIHRTTLLRKIRHYGL